MIGQSRAKRPIPKPPAPPAVPSESQGRSRRLIIWLLECIGVASGIIGLVTGVPALTAKVTIDSSEATTLSDTQRVGYTFSIKNEGLLTIADVTASCRSQILFHDPSLAAQASIGHWNKAAPAILSGQVATAVCDIATDPVKDIMNLPQVRELLQADVGEPTVHLTVSLRYRRVSWLPWYTETSDSFVARGPSFKWVHAPMFEIKP